MEEIDLFFDFLKQHIENGGYKSMLQKYHVTPFETDLNGDGELKKNSEIYRDPNSTDVLSYLNQDSVITNKEVLDLTDITYINSVKQYIRIETYNYDQELLSNKTIYFYDNLVELYDVELGKFKNCYGKLLVNSNIEQGKMDKGILILLAYYIDLVDKQSYEVYNPLDGKLENLIKNNLQKKRDWLTQQQLNNSIQLEPKAEPIV